VDFNDYLIWTPSGLPGVLGGLFALAAAIFILSTTRNPAIRTHFSGLLAAEGVMMLTGIGGPLQFLMQRDHVQLLFTVHVVNDCVLIALYLPAIAAAVDTPMLRIFRTGVGRRVVTGLGGVLFLAVLAAPEDWLHRTVASMPGVGSPYTSVPGVLNGVIFVLLAASYIYGLLATVTAWRQSASPAERRQRGILSLSFSCRDVAWCMLYLIAASGAFGGLDLADPQNQSAFFRFGWIFYFAHFLYVALMAYAIAYYNVLEIDLVLKRAIRRSTVTAVLVVFFFVVSEGSQAFLSEHIGTLLAVLVTGALLFFLAPLQQLGEQIADAAMPAVQDTAEYRSFRRTQIYGAAVEDAISNGGLNGPRRLALDRLARELGLDAETMSEIEVALAS